ncbi:MAG TPA: hypothetical protein VHE79_09190 [Spirochaetia bacterium]
MGKRGKSQNAALYSSGPDESYVQAEVLFLLEKARKDGQKVKAIFYDVDRTWGRLDDWLKSHRPEDRRRITELRALVSEHGWPITVQTYGGRPTAHGAEFDA